MAQAKLRIIPGQKEGMASTPRIVLPQKSSAAFVAGAPVKVSAGTLVACSVTASKGTSSNLSELKKSSINNILGFADGSAAASSTGSIGVVPIREGMHFIGNLIHGTQSSAKAAAANLMTSVVRLAKVTSGDTHYGWARDAASKFTSSGASIVQGKIVELIDPASTVNGRVVVKITKGGAAVL